MNVLSLFDGMSSGQIALKKVGIKVDNYYASEIKKHGIKVTQENFPDTFQLGDVTKVRYENGVLYSDNGNFKVGKIDIVIGGSPCQNFSIACVKEKRLGLEGEKSKLFYEYLRILEEVNPEYFLLENVASMDKESKLQLDEYMKVPGIEINSLDFLPQMRKRLYWTNIPLKNWDKKNYKYEDFIEKGWYSPKEYSSCLIEGHSRPNVDKLRLVRRHLEKSFIPIVYRSKFEYENMIKHYKEHYKGLSAKEVELKRVDLDNSVYDCARVLNSHEIERLQGVPVGYCDSISRDKAASLLGDGWTIDVISHILGGLK